MQEKNITILDPKDFKNRYVFATEIKRNDYDDFFIHSLSDSSLSLQLPLPPHKKTVHDFIFVERGIVLRKVGIKRIQIQNYELLSVPKLLTTTTEFYSDNLRGYYCHFSDDFIADSLLTLNWAAANSGLKIQLEKDAALRILQLLTIIHTLYSSNWLNHKIIIAQYMRTVITEINALQPQSKQTYISKNQDTTLQFIQLIKSNLQKSYTIKKYAEMLYISPNHLNKTIKKQLGKSAQTVYNELLLHEAKLQLMHTAKDVSEIAFDLGFNDASYFSKFFKKLMHKTPIQYRNMIENYH